jgi:DNA-binding transcriptional ArsR family regulator
MPSYWGLSFELNLGQPVAFQHLAVLRRVGLVNTKREGKEFFYSVKYARPDYATKQSKTLYHGNQFYAGP